MRDPFEYLYPLPAASPLDDIKLWIPLLLAAVDAELDNERVWAAEDADTALGYVQDLRAWLAEFEPMTLPVGMMTPFAGADIPAGWLSCDGAAVSRAAYPALFALVGTTYGPGDGESTFNLPDMRRRVPAGPGNDWTLGSNIGAETHTLTIDEMPSHNHTMFRYSGSGGSNGLVSGSHNPFLSTTTGNRGGGQAHNNVQPTLVTNYIIRAV